MRTTEFKIERQGLVDKGGRAKIIEQKGTNGYSYIIDSAVTMSDYFAARYHIKSEYETMRGTHGNSQGFYVITDFDKDESR